MGSWRAKACCSEHFQLVEIFTEVREGIINAKEATQLLANIGITADSELNYLPSVVEHINGIIASGTPKKVSKPKSNKKSEDIKEEDIESE